MLELIDICAGYTEGKSILNCINLTVGKCEIVGVIGQNGSGKSTLAKTIMNLVPNIAGEIKFYDKVLVKNGGIRKNTWEIADLGLGYMMQGGRIFPHLTTKENLEFATRALEAKKAKDRIAEVETYFDLMIGGRKNLQASYLSGGEQHQLALAMVLVNKPALLILDEPSAGLSPINIKSIYAAVNAYRKSNNTAILLIEQNITMAFENSDKIKLLENGSISLGGYATGEFRKQIIEKLFNKQGEHR